MAKKELKMKIAFIGIKSYPAAHGGMEIMTQSIVESLGDEYAHRYTFSVYPLIAAQNQDAIHNNIVIRTINVRSVLYLRSIIGMVSVIPMLLKDKPDLIHVNGVENSYIIPVLKLCGFKVVLNIRGIRWTISKWGDTYFHLSNIPIVAAQIFFNLNIILFSWCADKVVTVNDYAIRFLPTRTQKKTQVIYNSLHLDYRNESTSAEQVGVYKIKPVVFIGRIVPLKGLHLLIQAYNSIGVRDEPLLVVGRFAPDKNRYHKYLSRLSKINITFVGSLYGNEKLTVLANAALIVLPSETEGMAVTILEAALLKIPILVSNIPENTTLWEDSIHYFRNRDVTDLMQQLELLLDDTAKRKEKIHLAYQIATEKFNHKKQIDLYDTLYQSLH